MASPLGWFSVSILALAIVVAQSQPDFSGRWVLVGSDGTGAEVARTLTVQQPIVRTNVYGAPMQPSYLQITIERQFASAIRADTYLIGVRGGTVTSGSGPGKGQGQSTSVFARWENDRLVIDTGTVSEVATTGQTEVWQYDDAGLLTVSVTERSPNVESRNITARYRRDSGG